MSSKIRNWCVTVWSGTLVLSVPNRPPVTAVRQITVSVAPIVCFWFLDALQHVFIRLHIEHANRLERFLLGLQDMDSSLLYSHTLENAIQNVSYSRKLKEFFTCAFGKETVTTFYVLLLIATLVVVTVIR